MWTNSQETADLVTFTEQILMENFIFCAVWSEGIGLRSVKVIPFNLI